MSVRDRLIQLTLRARNFLSGDVAPATESMRELTEEGRRLKASMDEVGRARGLARTLRDNQQATEGLARSQADARATLDDLTREIGDHEKATAGQRIALREARRTLEEAERAYKRNQQAIKNTTSELKKLGVDTDNVVAEEKRLTGELENGKQALAANREAIREKRVEDKKAADAAKEHASAIESIKTGVTQAAVNFSKWLVTIYLVDKALQGLAAGAGILKDGIRSMLSTGDDFELLGKRMASLMGSVAAGEQATAWIKQFAKDTPLQVQDVTEAFALLKSYGLDPMDGTLQAVVDKNEQLGGGMERLQGIASALGQAYAKQKLQTEEILQLVERGVPVWSMLEKVTGKNAAQLADLASKGRLGRDVIAALIKEIGASAQGAAADNMGTLTGLVSNLSDTWTGFLDRIAKSGALDYAKQQLAGVADYIEQMDRDGRLDKLAQSLSDAFSKGAERVKEFIGRLVEVDFSKLIDDSTRWLNGFDDELGESLKTFDSFISGTKRFWNALTLAGNAASTFWGAFKLGVLETASLLAGTLPDALGGAKWKAKIDEAASAVRAGIKESIDGVKQDAKDLADSLGAAGKEAADSSKEAAKSTTDAVKSELEQQRMLDQAHADQLVANQHKVRDEAIAAAVAGTAAITDMGNALNLLDTARTREQLEGLRKALLAAYESGRLSQEEYSQATGVLNARLRELGTAAGGAADLVSDLDDKLGDLKSVQDAISNARTDVDINNIRAALKRLYDAGKIGSVEYNTELTKLNARQKELTQALQGSKKAQDDKNKSDQQAIVTSEQLRRESGKRMEAERKAGGVAMEQRRKEASGAKEDMGALEGFFSGVVSRAREGAAGLSRAALEAFEALRGLKSATPDIDTSGLEDTRRSLERVSKALADVQAAAANPMVSSLGRWALDMQRDSLKTQQAFLSQKASLQSLMNSYERGAISAQRFVSAGRAMRSTLGLLDDSDLSGLESAIDAANQRMKQMGDSTRSTLESLQDELDGLQGRTDDIERRRFAARQRELQAQLAEAQAGGDAQAVANASKALGLLRQIESESAQARQSEEQKKRMEAQQPAAAQQAAQVPSKVIRLEIPGRPGVDVAVSGDAAETNLLSILEQAGLRSL